VSHFDFCKPFDNRKPLRMIHNNITFTKRDDASDVRNPTSSRTKLTLGSA